MADGSLLADEARAKAYATPLDQFQVHEIEHFTSDTLWPWFERLRAEEPVHYTKDSEYGPYWSITRFTDIVACESDVARFSSSQVHGGITLFEPPEGADRAQFSEDRANFIALDPPRHDAQRNAVAPIFTTPSLAELEPLLRFVERDVTASTKRAIATIEAAVATEVPQMLTEDSANAVEGVLRHATPWMRELLEQLLCGMLDRMSAPPDKECFYELQGLAAKYGATLRDFELVRQNYGEAYA